MVVFVEKKCSLLLSISDTVATWLLWLVWMKLLMMSDIRVMFVSYDFGPWFGWVRLRRMDFVRIVGTKEHNNLAPSYVTTLHYQYPRASNSNHKQVIPEPRQHVGHKHAQAHLSSDLAPQTNAATADKQPRFYCNQRTPSPSPQGRQNQQERRRKRFRLRHNYIQWLYHSCEWIYTNILYQLTKPI